MEIDAEGQGEATVSHQEIGRLDPIDVPVPGPASHVPGTVMRSLYTKSQSHALKCGEIVGIVRDLTVNE